MPKKTYNYALPTHPVTTKRVDLSVLQVDPAAQRTLTEARITSLEAGWIPEAAGTITVSMRDDKHYVVDGQCRAEVARRKGQMHITADVHEGLTQQQDATLFLLKNRESSRPGALDEYQIGLTAELPLFTDTQEVLDKHSLSVGSTSVNSIGAINGILSITNDYGADVLDRVLTVAEEAWGRTDKTWDGSIIGGLGRFLGKHGATVDDKQLVAKLARGGNCYKFIGNVITVATMGGSQNAGGGGRTGAAYKLIVDLYNKQRKAENRIVITA